VSAVHLRHGLAVLLALLLAGCASAPPQPVSMRDPAADFAAYATWGFKPAPGVDGADQPLLLLDQNIRRAVAAQMQRRGYTQSDAPDLLLSYETASADKIENNPVRIGIGVGSWGGHVGGSVGVGSPSVRNYTEGTLVIHAIDARRNAEVWQGSIAGRLGKGSTEAAAIDTAVQAAMRDFPARN
jgi:hypothetical protein